ncbi:hypothetical protein [Chryseobacterium sp.]|uniref:hypothetical protein n=1 Tax=Chryseobacterium sp. TaxID=1871047 RepID=UPI0032195DFC
MIDYKKTKRVKKATLSEPKHSHKELGYGKIKLALEKPTTHKTDITTKLKYSVKKTDKVGYVLLPNFSKKKILRSEFLYNNVVSGRIVTYKIFKMLWEGYLHPNNSKHNGY